MTKKHFIAMADALKACAPVPESTGTSDLGRGIETGRVHMHAHIVTMLANFCQTQNSRFDRQRWLDYIAGRCGPNGGPRA